MPIYEFVCKNCDSRFETLVMNSDEHPNCTCCGSEDLEKQYSSFASHNGKSSDTSDTGGMLSSGGGCCGGGCACGH